MLGCSLDLCECPENFWHCRTSLPQLWEVAEPDFPGFLPSASSMCSRRERPPAPTPPASGVLGFSKKMWIPSPALGRRGKGRGLPLA